MSTPELQTSITLPKHNLFSQMENKITRRKPKNYEGLHPSPKKTTRRELTAIEGAFIAGAKSTVTRTVQRVNERALELNTTIVDPRCFEYPSNRGPERLLNDEQRAQVVAITIGSRKSREKESWQPIKDGDFENCGLPHFSISLHQNIMYDAGYARRRPGWKPPLTPEQQQERYQWALAHNPDRYKEGDGLGFDFRQVVFTDETPARIGDERGMQRVWCKEAERFEDDVKKDHNRRECCLQFYRAFRYNNKGPCYTYFKETKEQKQSAEVADTTLEKSSMYHHSMTTSVGSVHVVALMGTVIGRVHLRSSPYRSIHSKRRGSLVCYCRMELLLTSQELVVIT
ncbi:hypothetical protein EJ07DRAFT_164613 [Lizonia empirigonia]|nr:hypothetical protein EJ07DRAFT_164613 [Lizonia empirigonia]